MAWAIPEYSRNQVDKAGFSIVNPGVNEKDLQSAYSIINNWRSSHSYPLNTFQINLRSKIKSMKKGVLVAQRIKRLDSIKLKIERSQTKTIQLSQMQDIGGCRAVLPLNSDVKRLVESYKASRFAHQLRGEKDYINNPKADGYRCHHLIFQYFSKENQISAYDKLRIEIQIRTAPQHAWATALEAVGIFTRQALKSNRGSDEWLRFFSLTSSAIAMMEGAPLVPATPENRKELVQEITALTKNLKVKETLDAYGTLINHVSGAESQQAKYYLVYLNLSDRKIRTTRFSSDQSELANITYLEAERGVAEGSGDQVVLVSVDSVRALRRAYPNYFLDTKKFANILSTIMSSDDPATWISET